MRLQDKFAVPLFVVLSFFMLSVSDLGLVQAGTTTSEVQLFIFELNRARNNPTRFQTENSLSVDLSSVAAQPPLAVNGELNGSAGFKAQEMADFNYFSHQSDATGLWPNELARDFGYNLASFLPDNANNIESLAAGFDPVLDYTQPLAPLVLLIVDEGVVPPGHRIHLLAMNDFNQRFREIGVGYGSNPSSDFKNYWAIHTGFEDDDAPFLTGVVYNDANGNSRFDLDEGLSGVTVSAGGETSAITNSAGGWSIKTSSSGSKTVQCSGGPFVGTGTANVTVGSDNIEVDFISGNSSGVVDFNIIVNPTATITANSSGGPISLNVGDNLSVACSLDSGSLAGQNADWWVVLYTPFAPPNDWFHLDLNSGWTSGLSFTYQGQLFDLGTSPIFDMDILPAGTYTFYFAVDTIKNGVLDIGALFFDSVTVTVVAP